MKYIGGFSGGIDSQALAADRSDQVSCDNAELLRVLARLLEGKTLHEAFGAPGDWGYDTPIGCELAKVYKTQPRINLPGILKLVKRIRSLQREAERGDMEVVRRMREGEAELDECLKAYPI